jgi:glycosyltransferase involved in cell wall biosynthesis
VIHTFPHVLHVASGDLWAGAEAQIYEIAKALHERDDVAVSALILNPGRLAANLANAGIPTTIVDESRMSSGQIFRCLVKLISKNRPNIVHTHRQKENILGALAAAWSRIPSIRTVHGGREFNWHILRADKKAIAAADWIAGRFLQRRILAVSELLAGDLASRFPPAKIAVVRNGINVERIRASVRGRSADTSQDRALELCFSGRLVPVKRVDRLLDCLRILLDRRPNEFQLTIVGDGPERERLETYARILGIAGSVHFLGYCHDAISVVDGCDLLVLASEHEGLPMTVLEALSLGVPVVAPPVGGIPELVEAANFGKIARSGSSADLADAVLQVCGTANSRSTRQSRLPQGWTAETTTDQLVSLYEQVCRATGRDLAVSE